MRLGPSLVGLNLGMSCMASPRPGICGREPARGLVRGSDMGIPIRSPEDILVFIPALALQPGAGPLGPITNGSSICRIGGGVGMSVGRVRGTPRFGGVMSMKVSVLMVVLMDDMMDFGGLYRSGACGALGLGGGILV